MIEFYTLDLETAPNEDTNNPYALEPFRIPQGLSRITSSDVYGPGYIDQCHERQDDFKGRLELQLRSLAGKKVFAHNAIFDVSTLIATFGEELVKPIHWLDSIVLYKYLVNGQKADNLSFALVECVRRTVKEDPELEEFLDMKKKYIGPGEDYEYWLKRGKMDARLTYKMVEKLMGHVKPEMVKGLNAVCNTIFPLCRGYVHGIPIDQKQVLAYEERATKRQKEILKILGIAGTVITSTKQLGNLLFNEWGLEPVGLTATSNPSVSAENILRLAHKHSDNPNLQLIREYKKIATMMSKYIKGFKNARNYVGEWRIHGSPRILATKTGRMTYASKTLKKAAFQVSIAMHQIPRQDKDIKRCMVAPPGYKVLYMDVSAQEGRFMAMIGPEPRMIESYNKGVDLHSDLTEEIFGTPYDDIVKANHSGEPANYVEQRQAGKLTGLSSFYRISGKSLSEKFFATYEYDISQNTANSYLRAFKNKYPGVPEYWSRIIRQARTKGYTEAIGGWRYRIDKFDWMGESNAINHPIQGSAAIQTYATIDEVEKRWPDLILISQVHDSLAYFIPEENHVERAKEIKATMDDFNYGEKLGFNQTVKIVLDAAVGDNLADLTDVTTI